MTEHITEWVWDERRLAPQQRQREEIVRCRDCRWFTPESTWEEEVEIGYTQIFTEPPDCGNPERCSRTYDSYTNQMVPVHIVTNPDGFCAWASRKEEA